MLLAKTVIRLLISWMDISLHLITETFGDTLKFHSRLSFDNIFINKLSKF